MADDGRRAVLPPDETTWHLVPDPLAPRALCGLIIKFGARLRHWAETPEGDRCRYCVRIAVSE